MSHSLGPMAFKEEEPVYTLQRQPYPERGETRYEIWIKDEGIVITPGELSQLLANILASQVKRTDMVATDQEAKNRPSNPPSNNRID